MENYLLAQTITNQAVISKTFSANELDRFSVSDRRWAETRTSKKNQFLKNLPRKGDICQFEFGKNMIPEMSYEHRGLVIGVRGQLLHVLPIFSYRPDKHTDVFHPVDFPDSKSDLFLLKSSKYSFIKHDSVLKLNDIRTISSQRLLYTHQGNIPVSSETYQKIQELVITKYFPTFLYETRRKLEDMNNQISDKGREIEELKKQLKDTL